MNGAERIAAERERQKGQWPPEHDDRHTLGELAMNAVALAIEGTEAEIFHPHSGRGEYYDPWGLVERHKNQTIRSLEIAGALIAAEIDRELRRK